MPDTSSTTGDRRTFVIIGAALAVHRALGCGFLESIYRRALAIEFGLLGLPFEQEVPCQVTYRDHVLGSYRMDFICFSNVIVEVKARSATGPGDQAQVISYLAATGHSTGLLLNFGAQRLEHRRLILSQPRCQPS